MPNYLFSHDTGMYRHYHVMKRKHDDDDRGVVKNVIRYY